MRKHHAFFLVLTPREMEVAQLVGQGYCNAEIARRMGWTQQTAENYLNAIYRKIGYRYDGVYSQRVRLALWALAHPDDPSVADQWIDPPEW